MTGVGVCLEIEWLGKASQSRGLKGGSKPHRQLGEECFKQREQETQRPTAQTRLICSGMETRPRGLERNKQEGTWQE